MTTAYLFILALALTAIASASAHRSSFIDAQIKAEERHLLSGQRIKLKSASDSWSTVAVLMFAAALFIWVLAFVKLFS